MAMQQAKTDTNAAPGAQGAVIWRQRALRLIRLGGIGLLALAGLGLAYKIKRVLRINVFPGIDMVPDEQLKAFVLWVLHLVF